MENKGLRYKITKLLQDNPDKDINDLIDEEREREVEELEEKEIIERKELCSNFWCKVWFDVKYYKGEAFPKTCPKCRDFDETLSGGVESEEKHYEGSRQDGLGHEVEFYFSKYKNGKGFWNDKLR